jgi:hypothetical protein
MIMKRNEVINRLVSRRLKATGKRKALCICMARAACFAGAALPGRAKVKA